MFDNKKRRYILAIALDSSCQYFFDENSCEFRNDLFIHFFLPAGSEGFLWWNARWYKLTQVPRPNIAQ
jgi:hypothetical protein